MPYLAKGSRPDINNRPGGESNSVHILAPAFIQIQLEQWLLLRPFQSWVRWKIHLFKSLIYGLVGAISEQGPRPDFNDGPGLTQTVVAFWPSRVHSSSTWIMAPSPSHSNELCQMEYTLFSSPTYGFLVGAISVQGRRPDFNNGLGNDSNSALFWLPAFIWVRLE